MLFVQGKVFEVSEPIGNTDFPYCVITFPPGRGGMEAHLIDAAPCDENGVIDAGYYTGVPVHESCIVRRVSAANPIEDE